MQVGGSYYYQISAEPAKPLASCQIKGAVPAFGGLLVKADSEGQVGTTKTLLEFGFSYLPPDQPSLYQDFEGRKV